MKKYIFTLILLLSLSLYATDLPEQKIDMDELSETLGHLLVRHLVTPEGFDFSFEKIVQGMKDEKANKPSPLTEEEYEQMIGLIQEKLFEESAIKNLAEANQFLQENKEKANIVVADEKLHYEIIESGEGEIVAKESVPLIHYEGKLSDGTVFASSKESGDPIALPIAQTIEGFSKGLTGMKEGEKRVLYIHPDLAYGVDGHLPPNSLLIFEVTIVKANSAPAQEELLPSEEA